MNSLKIIPINTIIHISIITIIFILLRAPLLTRSFGLDELYSSAYYLNNEQSFCWGNDWQRQLSLHPPFTYATYWLWQKLFGGSELKQRLLIFMVSYFGIIVLYFFIKNISNKHIAFFTTFAVCISPHHIIYSSSALFAGFEFTLLYTSLFMLYKIYSQKNYSLIPMLYIVNTISIFTFYHYLIYLLLQTFILWTIRKSAKIHWMYFMFIIFIIIAIPIFLATNQYLHNFLTSSWWLINTPTKIFWTIKELPTYY